VGTSVHVAIDDSPCECIVLVNEDASSAAGICHPLRSVLAAGSIGIVPLALAVAAFPAVPIGIYGSRSSIGLNPSSAVFARAFAREESLLTAFSALPRFVGRYFV